jgi:hypothetical protein
MDLGIAAAVRVLPVRDDARLEQNARTGREIQLWEGALL